MTWLWVILAFCTGAITCWKVSGWMVKTALKRSMIVDIIKNLKTESVVTLREEAEKEIDRRKRLLAEKARTA